MISGNVIVPEIDAYNHLSLTAPTINGNGQLSWFVPNFIAPNTFADGGLSYMSGLGLGVGNVKSKSTGIRNRNSRTTHNLGSRGTELYSSFSCNTSTSFPELFINVVPHVPVPLQQVQSLIQEHRKLTAEPIANTNFTNASTSAINIDLRSIISFTADTSHWTSPVDKRSSYLSSDSDPDQNPPPPIPDLELEMLTNIIKSMNRNKKLGYGSHGDGNHGSHGNHANPANHRNQNQYKTEMCKNFMMTGFCKYGIGCQFAHGIHELRLRHFESSFKTELCKKYWSSGEMAHRAGSCLRSSSSSSDPDTMLANASDNMEVDENPDVKTHYPELLMEQEEAKERSYAISIANSSSTSTTTATATPTATSADTDTVCQFSSRCKFLHDEFRIKVGRYEYWLISPEQGHIRVEFVHPRQLQRRTLLDRLTFDPPVGPVSPLASSACGSEVEKEHNSKESQFVFDFESKEDEN